MKLWLLRPINENVEPFEPWYDKCFGLVIRAETEARAREMAGTVEESEMQHGHRQEITEELNPWMDPSFTTCVPLSDGGTEEIVIVDERWA